MYFLKIIILARKNDKMLNVPVISSAPKQCNILIDENILRMKFKCDVGKTDITSIVSNATVNYSSGVSYSVKNGICYVQFTSVTTTTASNGQYILSKGTLPSIDNSLSNGRYPVVGGGSKSGMVFVDGNTGGVRYYGGEMTIFTTISYPVSES